MTHSICRKRSLKFSLKGNTPEWQSWISYPSIHSPHSWCTYHSKSKPNYAFDLLKALVVEGRCLTFVDRSSLSRDCTMCPRNPCWNSDHLSICYLLLFPNQLRLLVIHGLFCHRVTETSFLCIYNLCQHHCHVKPLLGVYIFN